MTIMGNVKNMNHADTKEALFISSNLINFQIPEKNKMPCYNLCFSDRPKIPAGLKIRISTRNRKAKTSS